MDHRYYLLKSCLECQAWCRLTESVWRYRCSSPATFKMLFEADTMPVHMDELFVNPVIRWQGKPPPGYFRCSVFIILFLIMNSFWTEYFQSVFSLELSWILPFLFNAFSSSLSSGVYAGHLPVNSRVNCSRYAGGIFPVKHFINRGISGHHQGKVVKAD